MPAAAPIDNQQPTRPAAAPQGNAGLVPFLSLFLLLLVFFLFLISLSRVEVERTHRVIGSLTTTFRAQVVGPERAFAPAAGPLAGAKRLQRDLTGLLRGRTVLAGVEIARLGSAVRVDLPAAVLFAEGEAELRGESMGLLEWAATAVSTPPAGLRHRVDVLVSGTMAPEADAPLAARRAAALAQELVVRGAPTTALAAGVFEGPPGALRLVIRVEAAAPGDDE